MVRLILIVLIMSFAAAACTKKSNSKGSPQKAERKDGMGGSLTTSGGVALSGEKSMVLDLTYNPDGHVGDQASTLLCVQPFGAAEEIGTATCKTDAKNTLPLLAKHVSQRCSGANDFNNAIAASEELSLTGCEDIEITLFKFEPALSLRFPSVMDK